MHSEARGREHGAWGKESDTGNNLELETLNLEL
jgi:hypothetical protein